MRLIIILATLLLSTSAMAQTLTELTDAHHRSAEEKEDISADSVLEVLKQRIKLG